MITRHPKRRVGNLDYGTYAPPSSEQNIRRYQAIGLVAPENIVLPYKFYGRLGFGEESKLCRENSINTLMQTIGLNKENPFIGAF